ncbi:MAG: ABC transporter ATP-binding protein [Treponema sp.]|nr:ABC transporter ATP-binding protein [Treponema sp.]
MSNDIAIRVENVSKYYRLGVINNGTLFRDIQSWMARKRGKEDPHAKIGSKYDPTLEGFWALKDLNFEIKKGDRVGIIGHNGAGKSTLLKILSGITTPTEGNIKINGRISSLLEVGTGFHPEMTGRENVYLNGAILGMKKSEIDRKIDEIIEFSEIKEHIDTPVKRYSSGMYVRLAFAVAAHLDSDILIADEVLAVGDAAFQKKALGKMNELSSGEGRTVLFVSHNMAQVKNLCNKGIVLEKGRVVYNGTIEIAAQKYLTGATSIDTSDIESIKDNKIKRGAGWIHFRAAHFDKNRYKYSEPIFFGATVHAEKKTNGLLCKVIFKDEAGNSITGINYIFAENTVEEKKTFSFNIRIEPKSLIPGTYNIYLWLGDNNAVKQGNPDNYEVLENLLTPITIEAEENCNLIDKIGYYDINYKDI